MQTPNLFIPIPLLILLIWIVMCLARKPFHRSMESFSRIVHNGMRLAAASVKRGERLLGDRNREVLMAAGLEMAERKVEREFDRIGFAVQRDLEGFPQLQRQINEELHKLEEDYEKCGEIPQTLPDWVKVIDAIANIKPSGDRMVVNMLEDIHDTLSEQHKAAVEQHRRDISERHKILSRMLPQWRGMQKILSGVEKVTHNLLQRSTKIDRYMDAYQKTYSKTDFAERQLSSSSLTQFFVSGLVLAVAAIGAVINFNLVALPMSEMVGGASYIGPFLTSDVAGMFIVSLEIVVGVFLMDALRVTRLFSIFGSMDDGKRRLFFWVLLVMLTILATVESSLAFMRDRIAADMEALRQSLAGVEPTAVATSIIPTMGQMIMGFILPFILTCVAIPFESFVSSTRTLLGITAVWGLRIIATVLRLMGNMGYYSGRLVINLYDFIIFPGVWIEEMLARKLSRKSAGETEADADTVDATYATAAAYAAEEKPESKIYLEEQHAKTR